MAEYVGGEPILVDVDKPITFENKTDTAFDVGCGIMFHKSGLYRVSIVGRHMSVAVESEQKVGRWIDDGTELGFCCSECGSTFDDYFYGDLSDVSMCKVPKFCPNCGAKMNKEIENF